MILESPPAVASGMLDTGLAQLLARQRMAFAARREPSIVHVNAGDRPLALYYFGHRKADTDKVLKRTHSGGVTVNGCGFHAIQHHLPFGGVGASGIGAYHGQTGFERFSLIKPIMYMSALAATAALLRPPYGRVIRWVLGIMLRNRIAVERY
jgi:coniferyl-aldehyde dehydrogenase